MPDVLILHTGGTLGMSGDPPTPAAFETALTEAVPELEELADLETRIVYNLDSSDIGPTHWSRLSREIYEARHQFDGFVIVHGTDTMAYSASALSFSLLDLDRPVIFTGAQRPLSAHRTDARRNLVDAVELATKDIEGVGICFDGLLLRGVQTTKSNVRHYRAFDSPGVEPLAQLGVDVAIEEQPRGSTGECRFRPDFDDSVLTLRVVPGMKPELVTRLVDDQLRGLVLAAYGLGTVPTRGPDVAGAVEQLVEAGVDVLAVTQSAGPVDLSRYENSRALREAGAIAGGEMTIEAGVTKMMHALANVPDRDERRGYLLNNIAGERSGQAD